MIKQKTSEVQHAYSS